MPHSRPTLVHIEDDRIIGDAIRRLASTWSEINHVGLARTLAEGLGFCRRVSPDLVLIDVGLPDGNGFDAIEVLATFPKLPKILLLTGLVNTAMLWRVSHVRVAGVIGKPFSDVDIVRFAITETLAGRTYVSPEIRCAQQALRCEPHAFFKILSKTDLDLLPLIRLGLTDAEIAAQKLVGLRTIRERREAITRKLGLSGAQALMRWVIDNGFT